MAAPLRNCVLLKSSLTVAFNSNIIQKASYQKVAKLAKLKAKGGLAAATVKKHLDVETDVQKLTKYVVGANIYKEGSDPEIKADSEYPEWLWTLRTQREAVPLEDLDKDTWEYWRRLQKLERKRASRFQAARYRFKEFGRPKVPLD